MQGILDRPAVTIRYVGTGSEDRPAVRQRLGLDGSDCELQLSTVHEEQENQPADDVDCLVLGDGLDTDDSLSVLGSGDDAVELPPAVAIERDPPPETVEELLASGVTDVVRGSGEGPPPALVRRRIESAVATETTGTPPLSADYETIFETAADAIYRLDSEGRIVAANRSAVDLVGYDRSTVVGSHLSRFLDEPDIEAGQALLRDLQGSEDSYRTFNLTLEASDGEEIPCETRVALCRDDGEVTGSVGVLRDLRDQRERERELQAERDLVERIFETSAIGIVVYDERGRVIRANQQAASVLGVPHHQLRIARFDEDGVGYRSPDGEPLESGEHPFERVAATGESVHDLEIHRETAEGDRAVLSVDAVPLFDDDRLDRVVVTYEDITERVERERDLEAQRDELERLDRINRIIRTVDRALVGANTRAEIEQTVCEELATSGRYLYAIVVRRTGEDTLALEAASGDVDQFDREAFFPMTGATDETNPGIRALETGRVQTIRDLDAPDRFPMTDWRRALAESGAGSLAAIPIVFEDSTFGGIAVSIDRPAGFSERELDVLDELGEMIGHAIAAVRSREREAILAALYEATQDLLAAETREAVSHVVVETAADVLEPAGAGIFLFDDGENVLRPVGTTGGVGSDGEDATIGARSGDSIVWNAYVSGERISTADPGTDETAAINAEEGESLLAIPLGEHGVFVLSGWEGRTADERADGLVGLLATTTEAALDRVAGKVGIRRRDQRLEERDARLATYRTMMGLIEDFVELLQRARTRTEIEADLCDRIVDRTDYSFAWIGAVPPDEENVEPRHWAGAERGYLDAVTLGPSGGEPSVRAAADDEIAVVENVADHLRDEDWAGAAVDRDFQSVLSVPLSYENTMYGILSIYAREPRAFGDIQRSVFSMIGGASALSITAVETRRGILAGDLVELELVIPESTTFLSAVAQRSETPVTYRKIQPRSDGTVTVLFGLGDAPVSEILALESEFVAVESLNYVEREDEQLFRARLASSTIAPTLLNCGAIPQTVSATADETTAVVRIPRELNVREFLERVRARYPETELVTRKDVSDVDGVEQTIGETFAEDLTERQREVLETAYETGFFESPRETTGVELADLLDISQPTVTHHLREAQRRLFADLFEEEPPRE